MIDPVAVILTNYNMPEFTDAIIGHVKRTTTWPVQYFVVDNGSDLAPESQHTTVRLSRNGQTMGGWIAGLEAAKQTGTDYLAYWILTTSFMFVNYDQDPVAPLAQFLVDNEKAVAVHPALTPESGTAHIQLKDQGTGKPRRTFMMDNVACMWRADWLDSIDWFRRELTFAWGAPNEASWKARASKRTMWVHEGVRIGKVQNVGYILNRMNMSAERRGQLAMEEVKRVLGPIYGPEPHEKLNKEFCRFDHGRNEWVCND